MTTDTVSSGQTSSDVTLNGGDDQYVNEGGIAISTTVDDGGYQGVDGTALGTVVSFGGYLEVFRDGTARGSILLSGSTDDVYGTAIDTVVSSGGNELDEGTVSGSLLRGNASQEIVVGTEGFGNAIAFDTVVSGGATQQVYASGSATGTAIGTVVSAGGWQEVVGGGTAIGTTISSGGLQWVMSGGDTANGVLSTVGTAISTTVANGGTEDVFAGAVVSDTILLPGGTIDVTYLTYVTGGSAGMHSNELFVSVGGQTYTQQLSGDYTGASFRLAPGADGGTDITEIGTPCYGDGTRLLAERGEVPVEELRVGERLITVSGRLRPIRWIGHRRAACLRHPRPHEVWPVRVAAGAFAADLPRRDLLLSPDHAVFVDGALIPIRYLTNGATVVQEPADAVTYWHVELPSHDLLLAEGLPCESYLDTGNRGAFANGGGTAMLHPAFALQVWEAAACAPLLRSGAALVAVRVRLLDRAVRLGHCITLDSDVRLLVGGRAVRPWITGGVHRFALPPGARVARLLSRSATPAAVRAASDDHRRLGVAVSRIVLDRHAIPLADPRLGSGWHAVEPDGADGGWRWTDGDARLNVAGARVLEVEVVMTEHYWHAGRPAKARVAQAAAAGRAMPVRRACADTPEGQNAPGFRATPVGR